MSKLKYIYEKDPWMLAEDIPDIDFFFTQIWLSLFVNEFVRPGGRAYKKILSIHKGYHQWFYFGKKDSKEIGDHLVDKFLKNSDFVGYWQTIRALPINDNDERLSIFNITEQENKKIISVLSGKISTCLLISKNITKLI